MKNTKFVLPEKHTIVKEYLGDRQGRIDAGKEALQKAIQDPYHCYYIAEIGEKWCIIMSDMPPHDSAREKIGYSGYLT